MTETKSEYSAPDPTEIDQIRSATKSGEQITLNKKDLRNLGDELAKLRSPRLHMCDIRGLTFTGLLVRVGNSVVFFFGWLGEKV